MPVQLLWQFGKIIDYRHYVTPPVGMNLYVVSNIAPDVPLTTILKGSLPFLLLAILGIVIVMAFLQVALWLPSTMLQ